MSYRMNCNDNSSWRFLGRNSRMRIHCALSAAVIMLGIGTLSGVPVSATDSGGTVCVYPCINFETYPITSLVTKNGDVITTQYNPGYGVIFTVRSGQRLQILTPVVGTKSSPRALGLRRYVGATVGQWLDTGTIDCRVINTVGTINCTGSGTSAITIQFSSAKKSVSVFTGLNNYVTPKTVDVKAILIAYDSSNAVIARKEVLFSVRTTNWAPITREISLSTSSATANIKSVKLFFELNGAGSATVPLPVIDNLSFK